MQFGTYPSRLMSPPATSTTLARLASLRRDERRRRNAIMGLSVIDLLIIASVILCMVVFLMLLNWMSKKGDR